MLLPQGGPDGILGSDHVIHVVRISLHRDQHAADFAVDTVAPGPSSGNTSAQESPSTSAPPSAKKIIACVMGIPPSPPGGRRPGSRGPDDAVTVQRALVGFKHTHTCRLLS